MRLMCANSTSIFFRYRREVTYFSIRAMSRTMSRAPSCTERRILRTGMLGVQRDLTSQWSQSNLLARSRNLPSSSTGERSVP